MLVVEVIKFM